MKEDFKFLKKGIRTKQGYVPVWYSKGGLIDKYPKDTITIYSRDYGKRLPSSLKPEKDTDMMTDYFEKDRARIYPGTTHHKKIKKIMGW